MTSNETITLQQFYNEFAKFAKDNKKRWDKNEKCWGENEKRWSNNEKQLARIEKKTDDMFNMLDSDVMKNSRNIKKINERMNTLHPLN